MPIIRRTRVPEHPAADTESTTPRTPGTPHGHAADADAVRLALASPPAERTTLDGAWWPRSRSLSDELPGLVEELRGRGIRVRRVAYNPDAWEPAPRRLAADGRTIRLGWFRSIDPQLLDLTGDTKSSRLDLLVIPPETTAAVAGQAFAATTDRGNRRTPTAVLAALQPVEASVPLPRRAVDRVTAGKAKPADGAEPSAVRDSETAVWDSEGGRLPS
jgi:Family of unknown function (DUF5994)